MKVFRVCFCLLLAMSLLLSVGVAQADPEENNSRIQNIEIRVDNLEIQTQNPDADTLDGLDSTDFADSSHTHPGLQTGVHWIGAAECQGTDFLVRSTLATNRTSFPASAYCPISLPFKCTITEVQFKARDDSFTSDMVFEVHDGYFDTTLDENVPIVSTDTSGWTSTTTNRTYGTFTTGPISLPYDPTNFDYEHPWWLRLKFNATVPIQRLRWTRIYYTIP